MNNRKNPLVPMGAITGKPGREELRANLEAYRKAGIEQFLIYPRSGLEVEYMPPAGRALRPCTQTGRVPVPDKGFRPFRSSLLYRPCT